MSDELEYILISPVIVVAREGEYEKGAYSVPLVARNESYCELQVTVNSQSAMQEIFTTIYPPDEKGIRLVNVFEQQEDKLVRSKMYRIWEDAQTAEVVDNGCGYTDQLVVSGGVTGEAQGRDHIRGILTG